MKRFSPYTQQRFVNRTLATAQLNLVCDVTYLCAGGQQVDEVDEVSEMRLTLLALEDGLARVTWLVEHVRDLVVVL